MAEQATYAPAPAYVAPELRPWHDLRALLTEALAQADALASSSSPGAPYAQSIRDGLTDDLAELASAVADINADLKSQEDDERGPLQRHAEARQPFSMPDYVSRLVMGPRR